MVEEDQRKILSYVTPRKRPRQYFNLSSSDKELAGCLAGVAGAAFAFGSVIALFFISVSLASKLMQRVVISMAYGSDRYAAGLRIVRKFRLSDGATLPGGWQFVFVLGIFLGVCLVVAPYVRLLQRWGLLRDEVKSPSRTDAQDKKSES